MSAAPLPALPAPVELAKPDKKVHHRKQDRPFDIKLLIIKLEIARVQQQIALQSRKTMEVNPRTRDLQPSEQLPSHIENTTTTTTELPRHNNNNNRASYVPRNAARQFAATTTPMKDGATAMKQIRRAKSTHERRKPEFHDLTTESGGGRAVNPKQFQAARSMGMTDEEAAAVAAQAEPKRASHMVERKAKRESRAAAAPVDKGAIGREMSEERRRRRELKGRSHSPEAEVAAAAAGEKCSSNPAMPTYRPGDAAKRNSAKRQSHHFVSPPSAAQGKVIAVHHASGTQHRESALDFTTSKLDPTVARLFADPKTSYADPRRTEIQDPFDFALASDRFPDSHDHHQPHQNHHHTASRPALKPHDRNDWAQESQAGDDMRHHMHMHRPHWGRRKSSKTGSDREEARRALEGSSTSNSGSIGGSTSSGVGGGGSGSSSDRPRPPLRQWSTGHMPDAPKGEFDSEDGVGLIGRKEKKEKEGEKGHGHGHRSLAGFFKRH